MRRLVLILAAVLAAALSFGHDMQVSAVRVILQEKQAVVSASCHLQALGLPASATDAEIRDALASQLDLWLDGEKLAAGSGHLILDRGAGQATLQVAAGRPDRVELRQRLFPEQSGSSTIVTILDQGRAVKEGLVSADHPSWSSEGEQGLLGFFVQGIEHILSGADHVLFVLGLILLGGSLGQLLKTVTAFTVAHSITLSLAATGVFTLPSRIVEPLIALSIVAIAVENLRARRQEEKADWRPWVAFGFGLIHGFGFAGALTELNLSPASLAPALLTFNLGVEAGQAAVILAAWPVIALLAKKRPEGWAATVRLGSAVIGCAGLWWFGARLLGM